MSGPKKKKPSIMLRIFLFLGLCGAVAMAAWGIYNRQEEGEKLKEWTEKRAVPAVRVTKPEMSGSESTLTLPGRLEAYKRAAIYSRVDGYLDNWTKDIGAWVKKGELLAVIDTPDLDQELMQAEADLNVQIANRELAEVTAARWKRLSLTDVVSDQDLDQKMGDLNAAKASVKAAQANVRRLEVLKTYSRIKSPFDGLVTMRNTDVGALISAGNTSGMQLFEVSDISHIRIYIRVPQDSVPQVRPGTLASITVPEYPKKTFSGKVYTSAGSVYQESNTTLMQLLMDNSDGELLPGGYANVSLHLPAPLNVYQVPSSAVIFDAEGLKIATLNEQDSTVAIKQVTIARNHGKYVDIDSGLSESDTVIINPPDGVTAGTKVKVVESKDKKSGSKDGPESKQKDEKLGDSNEA